MQCIVEAIAIAHTERLVEVKVDTSEIDLVFVSSNLVIPPFCSVFPKEIWVGRYSCLA